MELSIALVCFPVIFLGELPDKSMIASLAMASKGRPGQVWLGAAGAFVVHVTLAVSVGAALFVLLPRPAVEAAGAVLFLAGALYAWRGRAAGDRPSAWRQPRFGVAPTAFAVICIAEWGDLTQFLTADLAAASRSPISVALGAVLALWAVAGLAVAGGSVLSRFARLSLLRTITAAALVGLAAYSAWSAVA